MLKHRFSQRGFTLVELMIVVVIIGILASIAIPKFSMIVARSKLTELKQELWHIINMETAYYYAESRYEAFDYGEDAPRMGYAQPDNSNFTYKFDLADTTAYGMEQVDINFDEDTSDGLSVSISGLENVVPGTAGEDFAW